jgi:hypothetical protein
VVVAQGAPARLVESRALPAGATKELDELLRRHRAARLVRLVPGPRTLARCVNIPHASPAEAVAALGLIAEAELPETLPAHRRAAGLIPDIAREGSLTGLLTGWRDHENDPPLVAAAHGAPETWAAEPAALAALRSHTAAAVYADPQQGSIVLLISGPVRTVARVLVEDNASPEVWNQSLRRAIEETSRAAGASEEPRASGRSLLLADAAQDALAGLTGGKSQEPGWLDEFGLAFGAAILALSENPAERALAGMTAEAPRERRRGAEGAIAWLSVRRNAWRAVAAGAIALFVLPLTLAWARLAVLESKVSELHAQEGSREELARTAALYATLQKSRWPMTKLLADVSGALPVGVRVESIRLAPDQGLGLEATADSADALGAFQQNLNKSGIFSDVRISRADSGPGGSVAFEINAVVASPFLNAPPTEDFAAQPLAVRLYGEGASNTNWDADSDKSASPRPPRAERARPEGASAGGDKPEADDDGPSAPSRPSGSGSDELPDVLTDDQITAMDFNGAMKAWAARKKSLSAQKGLDQATKDRITSEIDRLKAQMDAKKPK